jgi:phosphoethanolamine N-methyltransferase
VQPIGITLDSGQYSRQEIEKYEAVYGRNFVSPGGKATAQEFIALLELKPGMRVLDVGCGIGGAAFYMAQQYGVRVHGIDISANMLEIARERCREMGLEDSITFERGDVLDFDGASRYDRVYSRDVFLHIADKVRLMQILKNSLLRRGKLLFTDYCSGEGDKSESFEKYITQRNYFLRTINEYHILLAQVGFTEIVAQDRTPQFITILERELDNLSSDTFGDSTLAEIRQAWRDKIARARAGEQRWGLFLAQRNSAIINHKS